MLALVGFGFLLLALLSCTSLAPSLTLSPSVLGQHPYSIFHYFFFNLLCASSICTTHRCILHRFFFIDNIIYSRYILYIIFSSLSMFLASIHTVSSNISFLIFFVPPLPVLPSSASYMFILIHNLSFSIICFIIYHLTATLTLLHTNFPWQLFCCF